jgi:hypothetical protein
MADASSPDSVSMLLAFRAENVRSFRDPLELSLEATAMAEEGVPRSVPWREGGRHPARVLPAAGVFGANASGKTNLLRAMDDMRRLVLTSFRSGQITRHPFRLDGEAERIPSRFEVDLILNGIRHEYGFVLDDARVIEEWAYRYPRGKAATLFRRKGEDISLGERNRTKGRAILEIVRPNSLFLSAAGAANHPDLAPLHAWFESNLMICESSSREARWAFTTHMLAQGVDRERVLELLHAADMGIVDARLRKPDPQFVERLDRVLRALRDVEDMPDVEPPDPESFWGMALGHQGRSGTVEFDVSDESLGTLVWFGLIGPVVHTLASGTVLLADELEASLHPSLVVQLVRMFQQQHTNPNGAQIIFNSHEAGLLGNSVDERVLGRDQVWFTEKLNDGRTRLYSLVDLNPRKDEAISKRYLAGRYGATPIISEAEFAALAAAIASASRPHE